MRVQCEGVVLATSEGGHHSAREAITFPPDAKLLNLLRIWRIELLGRLLAMPVAWNFSGRQVAVCERSTGWDFRKISMLQASQFDKSEKVTINKFICTVSRMYSFRTLIDFSFVNATIRWVQLAVLYKNRKLFMLDSSLTKNWIDSTAYPAIERNPVGHDLEVISIQVEKGIAGPYTY